MRRTKKKSSVAQSMAQAARLLKVHKSDVQRAKRSGAKCFLASGRIDIDKLRLWLRDNPASPGRSKAKPVDLSTLEKSLLGAVQVEARNLQLLQQAQARGDSLAAESLTAAYSRSQKNRLQTEKDVRQQMLEAKELITKETHDRAMHTLWIPIINALRLLPRKLSPYLVSVDEVEAHRVLDRGVEDVIAVTRKSFVRTEEEAEEILFGQFVASAVEVHGTGAKALAEFDALRARLVTEIAKQTGEVTAAATLPKDSPISED